ncbi:MAG: hypothetical protein GXP24_09550 [Planctomycetes bacterium]|nr:hypothetical protein [Planctomycetota bacterium]
MLVVSSWFNFIFPSRSCNFLAIAVFLLFVGASVNSPCHSGVDSLFLCGPNWQISPIGKKDCAGMLRFLFVAGFPLREHCFLRTTTRLLCPCTSLNHCPVWLDA